MQVLSFEVYSRVVIEFESSSIMCVFVLFLFLFFLFSSFSVLIFMFVKYSRM